MQITGSVPYRIYIGPTWVNVKMGCTHALRRRQLLNYGKRESTDLRWKFGSLCGREIECSAGSRECPFYFEICKTFLDDPRNSWSELNAATIRSAWNILEYFGKVFQLKNNLQLWSTMQARGQRVCLSDSAKVSGGAAHVGIPCGDAQDSWNGRLYFMDLLECKFKFCQTSALDAI